MFQSFISMKSLILSFVFSLVGFATFAQTSSGSLTPNFTATDVDGVEHSLYTYLDSGYQVILNFSATWCSSCWAYHEDGVLQGLHDVYGPEGTNDIRIFHIEIDDATDNDDLHGTGSNTMGDWVTGTPYPIIDNASNLFEAFANDGYPTIYTVCPNRFLTESGQIGFDDHAEIFQGQDCAYTTLASDGALLEYTGSHFTCGNEQATLSVLLMNTGLSTLTSCTVKAYDNGNEIASTDWFGELTTYDITEVLVGEVVFAEVPELTFEIATADDNDANDVAVGELTISPETTTQVEVRITTDNWPIETGWEIADDTGELIDSVAVGSLTNADTEYTWNVNLPGTACYRFTLLDAQGDGLFASQYGNYANGTAGVYSMDGGAQVDIAFEYDGASGLEFAEFTVGMEATTVAGIDEANLASTLNVFPNPTNGVTNIVFNTTAAAMATVEVYNLIGERVFFNSLGNLPAGLNRANLDLSAMEAGIYLVNLNASGETTTMRVTKQ